MVRILALSFVFVTLALSTLSAAPVDPAAVTCKEYNSDSHQGMLDIISAVYDATRGDPKLGALGESKLGDTIDKVCAAKPDAKVIDALQ
ncbi:opacity protein-like surface antigen [Rhizobium sp. BK313]|uniref:hypothetical protein n=1 Tax=Rhizobium sp. BK313 TaxID=2587081 RepID=UPI00105D336A|nr:hypothetical protein [Rhizobium sp. BK313]MBB3458201.1 opacity protein-like surface antigen [Rhizobium sp. BK313]